MKQIRLSGREAAVIRAIGFGLAVNGDELLDITRLLPEDLVDVLGEAIDENDDVLQSELLALTITVARLGSVLLAMRLGRRVIEEMQCLPVDKSPSTYSQN